jgi:hypothetical protein
MLLRLSLTAFLALSTPASAFIVTNDDGGTIGMYLARLHQASGERIVIDGKCASACTLYLSGDACATDRARLIFHAATHPAGTRLLMASYPQRVQEWIEASGGLSSRLLVADAPTAQWLIGACS